MCRVIAAKASIIRTRGTTEGRPCAHWKGKQVAPSREIMSTHCLRERTSPNMMAPRQALELMARLKDMGAVKRVPPPCE